MSAAPLPPTRHTLEQGMFLRDRPSAGPLSAGTLVHVHGLGESGLCFEHLLQRPELAELAAWHLLIPDLPGYGRSPWTDRPLSLAEQADVLALWLQGRATTQPLARPLVVVGHSMGGVVGQLLCERHPGLVDALVDVDGNLSIGDCVFSSQAAAQEPFDFAAGGFERMRATIYEAGRTDAAQRGYYVSLRLADPLLYHANSRDLVERSLPEDLAARLVALPMPTLYVAGAPGGASRRSRELLDAAGARWVSVAPSGHWPFIDQPEGYLEAVGAFLGGLGAAARDPH